MAIRKVAFSEARTFSCQITISVFSSAALSLEGSQLNFSSTNKFVKWKQVKITKYLQRTEVFCIFKKITHLSNWVVQSLPCTNIPSSYFEADIPSELRVVEFWWPLKLVKWRRESSWSYGLRHKSLDLPQGPPRSCDNLWIN